MIVPTEPFRTLVDRPVVDTYVSRLCHRRRLDSVSCDPTAPSIAPEHPATRLVDAAGAAVGLYLVRRSGRPDRGWPVAGIVVSVLLVVLAVLAALSAVLVSALSGLTF